MWGQTLYKSVNKHWSFVINGHAWSRKTVLKNKELSCKDKNKVVCLFWDIPLREIASLLLIDVDKTMVQCFVHCQCRKALFDITKTRTRSSDASGSSDVWSQCIARRVSGGFNGYHYDLFWRCLDSRFILFSFAGS